jgi:hypothetical protein
MRRIIIPALACMSLLPFHLHAEEAAKPLAFDTHDGYFVSNQFEPEAPVSFVVLRDQDSFDKVFGAAVVMRDKSHRLPPAAFDKKLVIAAIHRGKAMVTYQVESVVMEAQTVVVRYTAKSTPSDSAEFACPLILSLDKGDFKGVRFMENGKEAKQLEFSQPQASGAKSKDPDLLTEETADGKTLVSIRGKGIGRSKLALTPDRKPQETILRIYLRGLESLAIANDRVQWKASVLSHSGHATLLHLWRDGKEGPPLTKDSPYWAEIQRLGPDGKPAAGLPPAEGWFELRIPEVLLKDSRELKLEWIDFYR